MQYAAGRSIEPQWWTASASTGRSFAHQLQKIVALVNGAVAVSTAPGATAAPPPGAAWGAV